MTGYSSNKKAYIQVDGNYVAFFSFRRTMFVIHASSRISKSSDYIVLFQQFFGEFHECEVISYKYLR